MTVRLLLSLLLLGAASADADDVHVAVASNFADTLSALAREFEARAGHRVVVSTASTGKHYAQIVNGAPFEAFFAADSERPALLEKHHRAVRNTRFTYARGKLVLWSPDPGIVDPHGRVLTEGVFRHIAIANPKLAPYGAAARDVLVALGAWDRLSAAVVRGENVAQAYQFVASGNAQLGFVAYSLVRERDGGRAGSLWVVPPELHAPIDQQAVLLNETPGARDFLAYVKSGPARELIRSHGYDTP